MHTASMSGPPRSPASRRARGRCRTRGRPRSPDSFDRFATATQLHAGLGLELGEMVLAGVGAGSHEADADRLVAHDLSPACWMQASRSSRAARVKAHMFASRSPRPVSSVRGGLRRAHHREAGVSGRVSVAVAGRARGPGLGERAHVVPSRSRTARAISSAAASVLERMPRIASSDTWSRRGARLGVDDAAAHEVRRTRPGIESSAAGDEAAGRRLGDRHRLAARDQARGDRGGEGR